MSAQLSETNHTLTLSGVVDFNNANALYEQGLRWLKGSSSQALTLDLSALEQSNSLTLAIILQWIRHLAPQQRLILRNTPLKLADIMQASNLKEVLIS